MIRDLYTDYPNPNVNEYLRPYLGILLGAAIITTGLGIYAWRRRSVTGASTFAALMLAATVWAVANALEMAGATLPTKLFWANVQYMAYGPVSVLWFILALQYTDRREWLTPQAIAVLFIVPALTAAVAWTNNAHGLLRRDVMLDSAGPFPVIAKTYGPWFWIFLAYSYVLLLATVWMFIRAWRQAPPLYQGQVLILLTGLLLPVVWNLLYISGLSPFPRHDIVPAIFALSGILVTWGLFNYHLFNVTPVARAAVIELMAEGVVVLDEQQRIVDLNPSAQKILGTSIPKLAGQRAAKAFAGWKDLVTVCETPLGLGPQKTPVESENADGCYELQATPLIGQRGQVLGQLVLLRDISEHKRARFQTLQQQRALAVSEERERLAREMHDNLAQVLGYINVQAQAIQELLDTNQRGSAIERLARLILVAQEAQTDVREQIMELKATAMVDQGFSPTVKQFLQRYRQIYDLNVALVVSTDWQDSKIEPVVAVQLLRIIQEAFTNIRKHTATQHATITFERHTNHIEIAIIDNGQGFDPTSMPSAPDQDGTAETHFGLDMMRERAAAAGGKLTVESAPGRGTQVTVTVPHNAEQDIGQ